MAIETLRLLFKENREYAVGNDDIGLIVFDLILNETHNFSNEVTEHEVEDGTVITDHIKNNLENGSITGLITNFSIKRRFDSSNLAQDVFDEMKRIWRERQLVTVVTVLERYDDVAIVNVGTAKNFETGQSLPITLSFKKVNIVKLKTTQIDANVRIGNTGTQLNRQISPKSEIGTQTGLQVAAPAQLLEPSSITAVF